MILSLSAPDTFIQDLRYALRSLRRTPTVTAVAVLSLALGIGANTAIFTLIESTLLRPIPLQHPERLRLLTWKEENGGWVPPNLGYLSPTFGTIYEQRETPDGGLLHTDFTPRMYQAFRRDRAVFESLFAFKELGRLTAVVDGSSEAVNCFLVSGDFYRGMEISPAIGRTIGTEDDVRSEASSAVVISYQYWTRRFARSRSAIGKTIALNGVPVTIVGVNPEYFTGIEPGAQFEIWAPLNLPAVVYGYLQHGADFKTKSGVALLAEENAWSIPLMGRLRPGISDSRAQNALDALFQAQVDANPGPLAGFLKEPVKRPRFALQSASRGVDYLTERYDRLLLAVLALAGLVLLIACANVANLLLAKSAVRQREISLRIALGARRWRIARQLLTEGLLLAAMAGMAGFLFGYWTRNSIPVLLATPWRPSPFDTAFDPKVLLVSVGMTFLTGVLFSLAPVWQSRRVEVNEALKDGSRGTAGLSKLRMGRVLVALQVSLSVFVLVGAGLCVKTFTNLKNMPLGFQPERLWLFSLDLPVVGYPAERIGVLLTRLQERLNAIPAVESVTFTGSSSGIGIRREDQTPAQTFPVYASFLDVGSGFFETMGIRILNGRAIDQHDRPNGPPIVVVNQALARDLFRGENPIGQTFRDSNDRTYQIVGVCADWRVERLRYPVRPAFYGAFMREPHAGNINFEVRIARDAPSFETQVSNVVRSVDPNLAVVDLHTEAQQIETALSAERFMAALSAIFGTLALLLASIGLYGVMAYTVARRTNEIGIRVALGAQPAGIAWMVLQETMLLAAAGVAIGLPLAIGLSPILDHALAAAWSGNFAYGMKPDDPVTVATAFLVVAAAGLIAGYLPARRAARVDPVVALRQE